MITRVDVGEERKNTPWSKYFKMNRNKREILIRENSKNQRA